MPGVRAANNPGWLFCLDWEDNADKTMSKAKAREWIEIVESALGRPGQCVIYSGSTAKERLGSKADAFWRASSLARAVRFDAEASSKLVDIVAVAIFRRRSPRGRRLGLRRQHIRPTRRRMVRRRTGAGA